MRKLTIEENLYLTEVLTARQQYLLRIRRNSLQNKEFAIINSILKKI